MKSSPLATGVLTTLTNLRLRVHDLPTRTDGVSPFVHLAAMGLVQQPGTNLPIPAVVKIVTYILNTGPVHEDRVTAVDFAAMVICGNGSRKPAPAMSREPAMMTKRGPPSIKEAHRAFKRARFHV